MPRAANRASLLAHGLACGYCVGSFGDAPFKPRRTRSSVARPNATFRQLRAKLMNNRLDTRMWADGRRMRRWHIAQRSVGHLPNFVPACLATRPLDISMPMESMRRFNSANPKSRNTQAYSPFNGINIREPGCRLASQRRAHVSTADQSANLDAIFEGEREVRGACEHGRRA